MSPTVVMTMVISCERSCVCVRRASCACAKWAWYLGGAKIDAHAQSGIWHAGSCVQLLSRSAFHFVAVVVAQFGLLINEQVAKIHRRFAVHSCDLTVFFYIAQCCHALNKLDSSANEIYGIKKASGPFVVSSLRSAFPYIPWPPNLTIYSSQFAYTSIISPITEF